MMKRLTAICLALLCMLYPVFTCFAAEDMVSSVSFENMKSVSGNGESHVYTYSTTEKGIYNFAEVTITGTTLHIRRISYQTPRNPDEISVEINGTPLFMETIEWKEVSAGRYNGYETTVDASAFGDGTYTLVIKSSNSLFDKDGTVYTSSYVLTAVDFIKQGRSCYFPMNKSLSSQYNYSLLQRLHDGKIPNDFDVLKREYGAGENAQVLAAIEAKSLEITAGIASEWERVLAIYQWMLDNIAYDFDFPRQNYEQWVKSHPEEEGRLENPLFAYQRGYAMCYGYAKLFTLMTGYAGVESVFVKGRLATDINADLQTPGALEEYNHAWNAVNIYGSWYFIDTSGDSLYGYYRTNSADPGTGYTTVNRASAGVNVFPSLHYFSTTHVALRYGAENYGRELSPLEIPEGLKTVSGALQYYSNGVRAQDAWMRIDGNIYYFNHVGNAVTGWNFVDGYWRCFREDGVLLTGTQPVQEGSTTRIYDFDREGCITGDNELVAFGGAVRYYEGKEMITGWRVVDSSLRYFTADGSMYTGSEQLLNSGDGKWYAFTSDGAAIPVDA